MRKGRSGFTLLETLAVLAIISIISIVAVPNLSVMLANIRLRSSMSTLSSIIQNSRMLAVKHNKTMTTHWSTEANGLMAYVKLATDTSERATNDTQVQLSAPISKVTTLSGPGAPTPLTSATLGFTPDLDDPSFNSRGMPCEYSAGVCTAKGFVFYFTDVRPMSDPAWAAISVSPVGRIHRWFWDGTEWRG